MSIYVCVRVRARVALFPDSPGARVGKIGCMQTMRVFKTKMTKVTLCTRTRAFAWMTVNAYIYIDIL